MGERKGNGEALIGIRGGAKRLRKSIGDGEALMGNGKALRTMRK